MENMTAVENNSIGKECLCSVSRNEWEKEGIAKPVNPLNAYFALFDYTKKGKSIRRKNAIDNDDGARKIEIQAAIEVTHLNRKKQTKIEKKTVNKKNFLINNRNCEH